MLLCFTAEGARSRDAVGGVPVIRLRSSIAAAGPGDDTVYRYDRQALLDALRRQIGGQAA